MLGIDADPLVAAYDARYASAPVTARKVFEAELAGPGRALRPTSGGPRWSVLIGVVLVLVLVWALARLLVPPPAEPDDNGRPSGRGDDRAGAATVTQVPDADTAALRYAGMGERLTTTLLSLSAAPEATTAVPVVVRADDGTVVFRGTVGPGRLAHPAGRRQPPPSPRPTPVRCWPASTVAHAGLLGEPGEPVVTTFGG